MKMGPKMSPFWATLLMMTQGEVLAAPPTFFVLIFVRFADFPQTSIVWSTILSLPYLTFSS